MVAGVGVPTTTARQLAARISLALAWDDESEARAALQQLEALDPGDPWTALVRAGAWADLGVVEAAGAAWCEAAARGAPDDRLRALRGRLRAASDAAPSCGAWSEEDPAVTGAARRGSPQGPGPDAPKER